MRSRRFNDKDFEQMVRRISSAILPPGYTDIFIPWIRMKIIKIEKSEPKELVMLLNVAKDIDDYEHSIRRFYVPSYDLISIENVTADFVERKVVDSRIAPPRPGLVPIDTKVTCAKIKAKIVFRVVAWFGYIYIKCFMIIYAFSIGTFKDANELIIYVGNELKKTVEHYLWWYVSKKLRIRAKYARKLGLKEVEIRFKDGSVRKVKTTVYQCRKCGIRLLGIGSLIFHIYLHKKGLI